jgi:hypothetical protein
LSLSGAAIVFITAAGADIQQPPSEGAFADGDKTKLDGIEAGADVTDTTNVTAAGALMDSEVTNLAQVKAFDSADYATAAQGALADSALQSGDNISALVNDAGYLTAAGTKDFVASGTIANGDVVVLNSDGTVSVAAGVTEGTGTPAVFESGGVETTSSVYDSTSQKVVIAYRDVGAFTYYGTAVVGTVSGTSISFGTPVVFESASTDFISATFDSTTNKVVIAYKDEGNSNYGTAVVGTVSGTSISFGTPVVFESASTSDVSATYDVNAQKVVIAYKDFANSQYGTAIVGTVSGTSISFGTAVVFESATTEDCNIVYDSNAQKVVIAYQDKGNSDYGTAIVGTVSGTSISFGSPAVFESAASRDYSLAYDSNGQNIVIAYTDTGNSNYGTAVIGTVSGTSISFGSPTVFESVASFFVSATYDANAQKIVISYRDDGNSSYGTVISGTVSGTSISFGTPAVFESAVSQYMSSTYDESAQKVVISYQDSGNSSFGTGVVFQNESTNVADWVGIAAEGIADAATGAVNLAGSVNSQQSGLTIDATYYVNDAGSLTTTDTGYLVGRAVAADSILISDPLPAPPKSGTHNFVASGTIGNGDLVVVNSDGTVSVAAESSVDQGVGSPVVFQSGSTTYTSATYDANAQKVVIAYRENSTTDYGTAVVGTVSGTSISFGTPVVFESASTIHISATYDANAQKIVIAYQDLGNSDYGTAVVGTVSGTSISFGSPVVFESAGSGEVSATYDANAQKVVIAYRDSGNSNYGTAVVGTVSGTSISFGSPVVFESASSNEFSATYDANAQKVVIAYGDAGNSTYGTAVVGTVSGTSISFGSPVVFESAYTLQISATYDANAQKIVIAYQDFGNSGYGTSIVGTVSGTSISFGSPVVFLSASASRVTATYDANAQKVVVAYRDGGNSSYGTAIAGTVSGTSISFGSPVVFESALTLELTATYDANAQKAVIAYRDTGNSDYGTSVVFQNASTSTNLTAENYIGISDGAYSDAATATVQVAGAVDDAQSGLTAGKSYYVQGDGTLNTTPDDPSVFAGTAVSASKIIVKG